MKKILKIVFSIRIYIFIFIFAFVGTSCKNSCRKNEQNHIHNYDTSNIEWEWSVDEERAVAVLTCENNEDHQERIGASISKEATTNTIILTGTITYNNVKYSDKREVHFSPGLEYMLNEDGISYKVAGIGTCTDAKIIIPSIYNQLPVTGIKNGAFKQCNTLTNIKIPNSIIDIGVRAFVGCNKLEGITLPKSIKNIQTTAFAGCTSLSKVYYNGTIEDWCGINFENTYSSPMGYAGEFYIKNENGTYSELTKISIPDTITTIKQYQFVGFSHITKVEIPDTITSIESLAFFECFSLKYNEYNHCSYLGNWHNPYLVLMELKDETATNIIVHPDTKVIATKAFSSHNNITNMTIQNKVTHIGDEAFSWCSELTKLSIPSSVISIGKDILPKYEYGNNITTIKVDKNNPVYDSRNDCNAVIETATNTLIIACQNTIIPNSIVNIGDFAFQFLDKITDITIPKNIKNIGNYAFFNCRRLTNVYYEGTIEDWCQIKFANNTSNPTTYNAHFYMKNENNEYFEVTKIKIPNTITTIGNYQFINFCYITSIEIPNSVVNIGVCAFDGCKNLENVKISNGVVNIENCAFARCISLVSIEIPDSAMKIAFAAFSGCTSLIKVTIGKGMIEMQKNSFYECTNLKEVVFANTSGWSIFEKPDSIGGKPIDVTDTIVNATNLSLTYKDYWWKRS